MANTTTLLRRPCVPLMGAALVWAAAGVAQDAAPAEERTRVEQGPADDQGPVTLRTEADRVVVELDGEPFAHYVFRGQPQPIVWPLWGPGGVRVTRDYPMVQDGALVEGEARDHPHHRSLWFAHGDVDGVDFWHTVEGKGRTEHAGFMAIPVADGFGVRNRWMHGDREVGSDRRFYTFGRDDGLEGGREGGRQGAARFVDVEVTVVASAGDLVFGDTKEGTFGLRVDPALRVEGPVATAVLRNSEGLEGKAAWGEPARWIHCRGEVDGHRVGLAMFDHPTNLRHPTTWHARTYGLLAANPFGLHDFGDGPEGAGRWTLRAGGSRTFRYRVWIHGDLEPGADAAGDPVESAWRRWVAR